MLKNQEKNETRIPNNKSNIHKLNRVKCQSVLYSKCYLNTLQQHKVNNIK